MESNNAPLRNRALWLSSYDEPLGRAHAVGPDAVSARPGDLVFFSAPISARDDPEV